MMQLICTLIEVSLGIRLIPEKQYLQDMRDYLAMGREQGHRKALTQLQDDLKAALDLVGGTEFVADRIASQIAHHQREAKDARYLSIGAAAEAATQLEYSAHLDQVAGRESGLAEQWTVRARNLGLVEEPPVADDIADDNEESYD